MKEINNLTQQVDPVLLEVPEIQEAIQLAEEAGYTAGELEAYESYWKAVSSERTMRQANLEKGRAEGRAEEKKEIAKMMIAKNVPTAVISEYTGLNPEEIESIK